MDATIDRLQRETAASPGVIALGGGLPADELFPRDALVASFLDALRARRCPALQYGWPEGDEALREWIAGRLRSRGADVRADDVLVTNGAQQAIAIAAERLGARGARVGVDDLTYPAALDLFRGMGAKLVPLDARAPAAFRYVVTGIDNPRGAPLAESQRRALVEGRAPFVADEAYAELRFDGAIERPLLADARDRAWHVGTLSKTLCPGLRVGWLVPPPRELAGAIEAKRDRDLQAPSLTQAIARQTVATRDFDAHLVAARAFYAARAERLARALRRRLPSWRFDEPAGGFSIFVQTDLEGDDVALLACAAEHGVAFDPGRLFVREERPGPIAMRLCYSSVDADDLDEAAARLSRAAGAFRRANVHSRA